MVTIKIETSNAAFRAECGGDAGIEGARILRELADQMENAPAGLADTHYWTIRDSNGNTVGRCKVTK